MQRAAVADAEADETHEAMRALIPDEPRMDYLSLRFFEVLDVVPNKRVHHAADAAGNEPSAVAIRSLQPCMLDASVRSAAFGCPGRP